MGESGRLEKGLRGEWVLKSGGEGEYVKKIL